MARQVRQDGEVKYFDGHSLYVNVGVARQKDLEENLGVLIHQLNEAFPDENYGACTYVCNVVSRLNGEVYSYAYIRLSDTRIVNILMGLNPDGSKRISVHPDPRWTAPKASKPVVSDDEDEDGPDSEDEEDSDVSAEQMARLAVSKKTSNWGDDSQTHADRVRDRNHERERRREEIEKRYTHPMIEEELGPIAAIPSFDYDEQQIEGARELLTMAEEQRAKINDEDPIEITDDMVPTTGGFECGPAGVNIDLSPDLVVGCLGSVDVPLWVTEEMLRPYFEMYNTAESSNFPVITFTRRTDRYTKENLPVNKVTIQYCNYGNSRYDSEFARRFVRKFRIENSKEAREREAALLAGKPGAATMKVSSTTLIFDRWQSAEFVPKGGRGGRGGYRGQRGGGRGGNSNYQHSAAASSAPRQNYTSRFEQAPVDVSGKVKIASNAQFFHRR